MRSSSGDEGVALALDARDDLADEATADAVGLDEDEGALRHEELLETG